MSAPPAASLCVFAGSNTGQKASYAAAARAVIAALARRGHGLVYGGGNVGLMNELAEAALGSGVYVLGVIPHDLVVREVAHTGISDLEVVDSMLARKALMAERSQAFLALPGGLGTLDELFEVLTWLQLGIHDKPCGVLNVDGYYDRLLEFVAHAVEQGFVRRAHAALLEVDQDPDALVERLMSAPR